jgi:hypothetical protein
MALGKRHGGAHVEAAAEEVSDEDRPCIARNQALGQVEPWRECADIQVDGHSDESVRFDDADHVRVRDRRHEDLVPGREIERVE